MSVSRSWLQCKLWCRKVILSVSGDTVTSDNLIVHNINKITPLTIPLNTAVLNPLATHCTKSTSKIEFKELEGQTKELNHLGPLRRGCHLGRALTTLAVHLAGNFLAEIGFMKQQTEELKQSRSMVRRELEACVHGISVPINRFRGESTLFKSVVLETEILKLPRVTDAVAYHGPLFPLIKTAVCNLNLQFEFELLKLTSP